MAQRASSKVTELNVGKKSDIWLVPYVMMPDHGGPSIPLEYLLSVYRQMESDGTLRVIFSSDGMRSVEDLILLFNRNDVFPVFIFDGDQLEGVAWLSDVDDHRAYAHFCFFKSSWGPRTLEMGRKVLDYWWSMPSSGGGKLFKVLIGVIPAKNQKALKFIERLNWQRGCEIPYTSGNDSTVISYIIRPDLQ